MDAPGGRVPGAEGSTGGLSLLRRKGGEGPEMEGQVLGGRR